MISEKGFDNYPDILEISLRKHELYNLIDKIIEIMVIRSDFMKKVYLANTASNTLSQIIRINWNEIFESGDIVNYLKCQFEKLIGLVNNLFFLFTDLFQNKFYILFFKRTVDYTKIALLKYHF